MTRSLQAKVLIMAVFIVGTLTGAVVANVYETRVQPGVASDDEDPGRSEPDRPPDFQRFEDFLQLTAEQEDQLDSILRQSRERYRELQAQTRPMYRDLTVQSQNEIRAILTEEQRNRYEEWITRLERRNRDRNGGGRNRDREDDGEENNRRPDE